MTLKQKIEILKDYDNTIITHTERGYLIDMVDDVERVDTIEELEAWVDYQLTETAMLMDVAEVYQFFPPLAITLYDDTTGEKLNANGKEDLAFIASRDVTAVDFRTNEIAVYVYMR